MKFWRIVLFLSLIICLLGCQSTQNPPKTETIRYTEKQQSRLATVIFKEFTAKNGLLSTNLTNRKNEYLAESMGLLMLYFIQTNDKTNYMKSFQAVKQSLILPNHLISWEIKKGQRSDTNALIDDLRIIKALDLGAKKWGNKEVKQLLSETIQANKAYTMYEDYFVDFGSEQPENRAKEITLSYAAPSYYKRMQLTPEVLEKNVEVIRNTPQDANGLYAKKFDISTKTYQFDDTVHMIDQLLTARNMQEMKATSKFHQLLKQKMKKDGKLYGQYDRKTLQPVVRYESPAVYSYAIFYSQAVKDKTLEKALNKRMNQLKNHHKNTRYYGSYIAKNGETHIFDNLLPLLTKGGWIR
ncbi:hypothetical protein AB0X74_05840 [Kurthia gibsonii]|uniref:hypothetical protein n=1 Tax=Kurthia TaxID=1649 RepID=UPI00254A433B|nr:hypothetical protein [Kurthia sp. YJT4]WIL37332.1 hypothetical protein QN089_08155 [Kurthia sp. YJT4]